MIFKPAYRLADTAIFCLFFAIPLQAQQQADTLWTLEECIETALKNNLTIQNSLLTVNDNEILFSQSKANIYPSLGAGGGYSNLWGRSIDPTTNLFVSQQIQSLNLQAQASFLIYGGSRRRNAIQQDKTNLLASNYDLETDKNTVMLDVTTAFLNVILNIELLENAKVQLNTTQTQLETTRKQVKAGALPYSNELDLIAQVESNKVEVIRAENEVRLAKLRLKQLLLLPSQQPFEVEVPEIGTTDMVPDLVPPDEVYATAETLMPQVKSADLGIESAQIGKKIARGGLDPTLSAFASMYTNYSSAANRQRFVADPDGQPIPWIDTVGYFYNPFDGSRVSVFRDIAIPSGDIRDNYPVQSQFNDNWSQSIGLNLQIPIFNGLTARSAYQRSKIQAERADLQSKFVRQQLRQNIELAYNNALAASQTYEASQKQVTSLEESFRATEKSYDLGARSFVDYQVAQNNLFRARSDLLRAKYNFIFTQKVLDFYSGKPLTLNK